MAVYTEVSFEDLSEFLARYRIGTPVSFKGIAEGVQNSNYFLQTSQARFILTLYERMVDGDDLPYFLGLTRHLATHGITCPLPVANVDGEMLADLNGRKAAIFTFLDGVSLRRPGPAHCASVGAALAGLHKAGQKFAMNRPNALGPSGWGPLAAETLEGADAVEDGLADLIRRGLDEIIPAWPKDLPAGVIHADLFPDNVLFTADHVTGLIDFYFACNDFLVYDLAVMLNCWCFEEDGCFNITKGESLISAYQHARPLSVGEIAALPVLARGAALRFLLTRLYDWQHRDPNALVRPKDPREYARYLRFHFKVRHAAEYGL